MTSRVLQIAPDLALPVDAATRRLAVLAMSGAGKSNTAVVLAEAMYDAGIPWVAIDPKGDWWGIRSSKSGKGPGLSIPIFGGAHGDVPLEAGAGKVLAQAIYAQRLTCVVDVSEFDEMQQMWGFLRDFGHELLRLHKAKPQICHLFLEECDEYIPQKPSEKGNQLKCLSVWQRVVKKGRTPGLGTTQITQRSASLNKDTLYQAELLIALRVTGKGDRDAIRGWVEYHHAGEEIIDSLATLQDGEGWLVSPGWLRDMRRVRFLRRRTFDSGGTPVEIEGDRDTPPAKLADVDLETLRIKMAETIEKVKAEDPQLLQQRIRLLERQLVDAKRATVPAVPARVETKVETKIEQVKVAVVKDAQLKRLEHLTAQLTEALNPADWLKTIVLPQLAPLVREFVAAVAAVKQPAPVQSAKQPPVKVTTAVGVHRPAPRPVFQPIESTYGVDVPPADSAGDLPPGELSVLTAVAQHHEPIEREQLTVITGYKKTSRDSYLKRLVVRGLIEKSGDRFIATQAGVDALGPDFEVLPTGDALRDHWLTKLPDGERKILEVAIAAYPDAVERSGFDVTGFKKTSRDSYLKRLVARGPLERINAAEFRVRDSLFNHAIARR